MQFTYGTTADTSYRCGSGDPMRQIMPLWEHLVIHPVQQPLQHRLRQIRPHHLPQRLLPLLGLHSACGQNMIIPVRRLERTSAITAHGIIDQHCYLSCTPKTRPLISTPCWTGVRLVTWPWKQLSVGAELLPLPPLLVCGAGSIIHLSLCCIGSVILSRV